MTTQLARVVSSDVVLLFIISEVSITGNTELARYFYSIKISYTNIARVFKIILYKKEIIHHGKSLRYIYQYITSFSYLCMVKKSKTIDSKLIFQCTILYLSVAINQFFVCIIQCKQYLQFSI